MKQRLRSLRPAAQRHKLPVSISLPRRCLALACLVAGSLGPSWALPDYPITPGQRGTAQEVAQAGIPLSELAPNAPDRYTVQRGDTLWDISKLYLRSPWRWPELWGMNLAQVANPHLIYPGQLLVLIKGDGRARLQFGEGTGSANRTVKLSPQARSNGLGSGPVSSIPLSLIQPFLTEAVVLEKDELSAAPRIVAARDNRVLLGRGDTAYVRGNLLDRRDWRVFRKPVPLTDPDSGELLGYEAAFVGTAEYQRRGDERPLDDGKTAIVPATFLLTSAQQEAVIGDRLMPTPPGDNTAYAPHAPTLAVSGRLISIYGQGLSAGQNQIVALNRGKRDHLERGHVLALLSAGASLRDRTSEDRARLQLPDERMGYLFVFQVFERVSYALIVSSDNVVRAGDRFVQP